jgi:hypothetical protein
MLPEVGTFTQRLAVQVEHTGLSMSNLAREVGCKAGDLSAALRGQPIDAVAFGRIAGWLMITERRWPEWMRAGAAAPPPAGRPAGLPDELPAELAAESAAEPPAEAGQTQGT